LQEKKSDPLEVMHYWKKKWEDEGHCEVAAGMKDPASAWSAYQVFTKMKSEEYYEKYGKGALQEMSSAWKTLDKSEKDKIEEEFKAQKERYNIKLDILRSAHRGI